MRLGNSTSHFYTQSCSWLINRCRRVYSGTFHHCGLCVSAPHFTWVAKLITKELYLISLGQNVHKRTSLQFFFVETVLRKMFQRTAKALVLLPPHPLCFSRPLTSSQLSVRDHSMGGAGRTFGTLKWQRSADSEQTLQLVSVHCKSLRESKKIQSSSHLRLHVLVDLKLEVQHQACCSTLYFFHPEQPRMTDWNRRK